MVDGVPVKAPVAVLKIAQLGLFAMLKASVSLFASAAVGRNEYAEPATIDVAGEPLIVGGVFALAAAFTVIVNVGRYFLLPPSLTLMATSGYEPTCDAPGVPLSRPVVVLKLAQVGRPSTR